uniref:Uncharacterized protein n=1 Tax=Hemiselmis andersenii TaxID=464988 RepID=A0A6T8K981_HEMAN|mmetsp:Transcript_29102/g.68079  ORF Transcript_29102/g.68079 Transcript_29102/m.68079 type:complete len:363 (+) Transcript_29102:3-1091(+)
MASSSSRSNWQIRSAVVLSAALTAEAFAPGGAFLPGGSKAASLSTKTSGLSLAPSLSSARTNALSNMNMLGIVITGAAGGVGFAYADEFMSRGHDVVICDISDQIDKAAAALEKKHGGNAKVFATKCDVSDPDSVQRLADFSKSSLGTVHKWINNAGVNGGRRYFDELGYKDIELVVKVNLLGALYCTSAAMKLLQQQEGVTGHIFNTVGSGVKGGGTPGYVCYGATKRGQPQMTDSLVAELEKGVQGYDKKQYPGKVMVHTLSPGMVFTQLLLDDSTPELRKFPFGVLAAQPEEVAADLVPKILEKKDQGGAVEYLTTDKVITKLVNRFLLGQKSEYVDDDGNVIKQVGAQYDENGVRALF